MKMLDEKVEPKLKNRVIDAHCHVGEGVYKSQNPEELIAQMDELGVDRAVVCPVEEGITVSNREANDYILQVIREFPRRLLGFAVANPWYGRAATEELSRALKGGLRGLKVNSSLQGFLLNDRLIYPLMEVAEKFRVPVYCHTGTPVHALPFQLADLADQFPKVSFVMGHMACTDFWKDVIPASKGRDNIYLETSLTNIGSVQRALRNLGPERIIFGSNSPTSSLEWELKKTLLASEDLEVREMIFRGNMLTLLGEKG